MDRAYTAEEHAEDHAQCHSMDQSWPLSVVRLKEMLVAAVPSEL